MGVGDQIRAGAGVTAHSTFRLSPETKELLRSLALFYDLSLTDTLTRLIRDEVDRRHLRNEPSLDLSQRDMTNRDET